MIKKHFVVICALTTSLLLLGNHQAGAVDLNFGDVVNSGDYTVTGVDISATGPDIFDLILMDGNGPSSTSATLTTGDIWTELNDAGVSHAWGLEFALNSNQTGVSPKLTVESLAFNIADATLAGDGLQSTYNLGNTITTTFDNGSSDGEATFRANLDFDFFARYNAGSTDIFSLTATHTLDNNGADKYFFNPVTVTPEPISTVLFLIGGAPMAMGLYRKKKRKLKI